MTSAFKRFLTKMEPRTKAEQRTRVTLAIVFAIALLGHATVLLLDDHSARMMYGMIGNRYLGVMFGEYGIGLSIVWLLYIHFVRPQNPWS